jgi:hypothetical protein
MARRTLRILPYKGNRGYHYYLDGLKVNGKRKRLFFTSEEESKRNLRNGISGSEKKAKTRWQFRRDCGSLLLNAHLAEWLRPYASMSGPLWEKGFRAYHVATRNLAAETELARWPNNGLHHSFASYHLAKHQKHRNSPWK